MSNPQQPRDDAAADDREENPLVDALLAEILGKSTPPDLSSEIMRQWREASVVVRASQSPASQSPASQSPGSLIPASPSTSDDVPVIGRRTPAKASTSVRSTDSGWALVLLTLAASLILGVVGWEFVGPEELGFRRITKSSKSENSSLEVAPVRPTPQPSEQVMPPVTKAPDALPIPRKPPRNMTLAEGTPQPRSGDDVELSVPSLRERAERKSETVQWVSLRAAQGLEDYWDAVGAEPSPVASAEVIRDRIQQRVGVELDVAQLSDTLASGSASDKAAFAAELQQSIQKETNAKLAAAAWLNELTAAASGKLAVPQRDALIDELAGAFRGEKAFDAVLASWIGGGKDSSSDASSAWYTAMSDAGEFSLVHGLASLTMNVDLRCTRCHDSLIDSAGLQNDYWSLAAMLRRDLSKDHAGFWSVRESSDDASPVFYERLDGRQTMAEAGVPQHWLDDEATVRDPIRVQDVHTWSESLVDSRPLARGVVNAMWRWVHDRPLRGDLADARSAPLDDSLLQLEELLADDLLASNFDVGRLLAIVLSSPATMRSIPESLTRQDAWAVDAKKVSRDHQSVQAFAAAAPSPRMLSIAKRLEVTQRSIGASLRGVGGSDSVLAQPLAEASSEKPDNANFVAPLVNGFPDHVDALPVQWLASVGSLSSQVKHLGYLAGREGLPREIEPIATAMREAGVPLDLTLHRVWWLLQR